MTNGLLSTRTPLPPTPPPLSPQALLLCKWVRKMRTTKRSSCQQMPCSYCFLRVLGLIHFFALFVLTCSQLWARMWLPQHIGHHTKSPLLCGQNASDLTDNSLAHAFAISSGTVAVWAVLDDLLSPYLLFCLVPPRAPLGST